MSTKKKFVQLENSLPPPHFSQLCYVPFSKFNLRITACYVTRLFWVVTGERIGTVGIVSWLIWVQTRMIADRKKSIMRTFKVKSACGENQLGMFTRLGIRQAGKSHKLSQWSIIKYTCFEVNFKTPAKRFDLKVILSLWVPVKVVSFRAVRHNSLTCNRACVYKTRFNHDYVNSVVACNRSVLAVLVVHI